MAFTPRLTRPEAGNKYYNTKGNGGYSDAIKGSPTDSGCDVLSNCVGYAYGRFNEIGAYGSCKYLRPVNAENFIQYANGLTVGQTPKLGACMVWRKGNTLDVSDGAGHVAIVEKVVSATQVVTSESGWGSSTPFYTKTRNKGDGNWGASGSYTFLGFIYNPAPCCNGDVSAEVPATPPITGTASTGSANDEKIIWNFFKNKELNNYAIAGIMGNLNAESALRSNNLQDSYQSRLGYNDATYTAAVDSGSYGNFVRDSAGYGLAQWTYYTRKQTLLSWAKKYNKSIGDLQMQLDFLWEELSINFGAVLKTLKSATSVQAASDVFMCRFENPADQSTSAKNRRAALGMQYYNKYAGVTVTPDPTPTPTPEAPRKTVEELAREVIQGKWGNGLDRKNRLTAAGYSYPDVQRRVDAIMSSKNSKSVDELAHEVIQGKWGNGAARMTLLSEAGYSYDAVQNRVNAIMSGMNGKSVDDLAREVIQGKWGNGAERKQRLTAAGYNYSAVQKRVNELMR